MTSEVIDYEKVRTDLAAVHKTYLYKALAYDRHLAPLHHQFTAGERILIHQYIGQGICLPSVIAYQLLIKAKIAEPIEIPKYQYNDLKQMLIKE